jgi:hypothetical protein
MIEPQIPGNMRNLVRLINFNPNSLNAKGQRIWLASNIAAHANHTLGCILAQIIGLEGEVVQTI